VIESPPTPPRSKVVGVASWLLVSLALVLVTAAALFVARLANVPGNLDRATEETNREQPVVGIERRIIAGGGYTDPAVINRRPTGADLVHYYAGDVIMLVAILVLIAVLVGTLRRLWRGSSGARTIAVIVAGVVAVGSVGFGTVWHGVESPSDFPLESFDYSYAHFEVASTPAWDGPVARIAIIALPLLAVCAAILLLSPPATEYFRAMRRSGTY
jgi:hypothetical protein